MFIGTEVVILASYEEFLEALESGLEHGPMKSHHVSILAETYLHHNEFHAVRSYVISALSDLVTGNKIEFSFTHPDGSFIPMQGDRHKVSSEIKEALLRSSERFDLDQLFIIRAR